MCSQSTTTRSGARRTLHLLRQRMVQPSKRNRGRHQRGAYIPDGQLPKHVVEPDLPPGCAQRPTYTRTASGDGDIATHP